MHPVYSAPYHAGATEWKLISKKLEQMLQEEVTKPGSKKWASSNIFASKKVLMRFCLEFYGLSVEIVKNSYLCEGWTSV